jgi:hypothetical protein
MPTDSDSGSKIIRVWGDFNGVFRDEKGGEILCLSHGEPCTDENGDKVILRAGMKVTAFEGDLDGDGNRNDLIASGIVEPAPDWLQCRGSRWVLIIDENGIGYESELAERRNRLSKERSATSE